MTQAEDARLAKAAESLERLGRRAVEAWATCGNRMWVKTEPTGEDTWLPHRKTVGIEFEPGGSNVRWLWVC